jgi:hypothetical protein
MALAPTFTLQAFLQKWDPEQLFNMIVEAIQLTYTVDNPADLQRWAERLAVYLAFVLNHGWKRDPAKDPTCGTFSLHQLFNDRPPIHKPLHEELELPKLEKQKESMHPEQHWRIKSIDQEKEFMREKVFEILFQPYLLEHKVKSVPQERIQDPYWYLDQSMVPYKHIGNVYLKLLELYLLAFRMRNMEDSERKKLEGIARDLKGSFEVPKPAAYAPYPRMAFNEWFMMKFMDEDHLKWDACLTTIPEKREYELLTAALPFHKSLLDKIPPVEERRADMLAVLPSDLSISLSERWLTLPPFLASILIDRNYNHALVLSACNWIVRTGVFGKMKMGEVAEACMLLIQKGNAAICAASFRALTAIAADNTQVYAEEVVTPPSKTLDQEALEKSSGFKNRNFLRKITDMIINKNHLTSSLVVAAACNFCTVLVPKPKFYDFLIEDTGNGDAVLKDLLPALNKLLKPVLHGERHDGKLLNSVCRFVKRLAAGDARLKLCDQGFVDALAELIFKWDQYFNAMEQCVGAAANLLYKLQVESVVQIMPKGWDEPPTDQQETKEESGESSVSLVLGKMLEAGQKAMGTKEDEADIKAREKAEKTKASQEAQAEKAKKKALEEKVRLLERVARQEKEALDKARPGPLELQKVLRAICLLLSRSASRIHRENCLLALRNVTYREDDPVADKKANRPVCLMNPCTAYLLKHCELETILRQLYSGYASVYVVFLGGQESYSSLEGVGAVRMRGQQKEMNPLIDT